MSLLSGIDAAYPPSKFPANTAVVLGYLGGNTPHVWTRAEWDSQPERYRAGIWTRSNPGGYSGLTEAREALNQWRAMGAPVGTLIALDLETAQDAAYVNSFVAEVARQGYYVMDYGSTGFLFGNPPGNAGYWPAVPGAVDLYNHPNVSATQTGDPGPYDTDLLKASLPFWDTQTGGANGTADTDTKENDVTYVASVTPDPTEPAGNTNAGLYLVDAGIVSHLADGVSATSAQAKFPVVTLTPKDFATVQANQPPTAAAIEAAVTAGLAGVTVTAAAGLTQEQAQAAFTAALATLSLTETSTLTAVQG